MEPITAIRPTRPDQRVTRRYVAALALVAALVTAALVSMAASLAPGTDMEKIVNIAGRQRMLSQQIALFVTGLAHAPPEEEARQTRNRLAEAVDLFETSHGWLSRRNEALGPAPPLSRAVERLYFEGPAPTDALVADYIVSARGVLAAPTDELSLRQPAVVHVLSVGPGRLLEALDAVVRQYETDGRRTTARLRDLALWAWLGTLGVLLLVGLLLFRPMARQIREGFDGLRRQAAELRRSERRLGAVFKMGPDAIVLTNEEGRVTGFNPAAERMFGFEADEIVGRNVSVLMPEPDRSDHDDHIRRYLRTGKSRIIGRCRTVEAMRNDGTTFFADLTLSEVNYGDERVFTGMLRDISERVAHERELTAARREAEDARLAAEAASRAKSLFLATMTHELRTPLNAVIGFSEMIANESLGPVGSPKYAEYARDVFESARHLLSLIDDILDIAKIEAGTATLEPTWIDLPDILAACTRILGPHAEARGVAVETDIPHPPPMLFADGRAVKQIIFNLLSNAIKFTPKGGRVVIEAASTPEGEVTIALADTGIGIPPDQIERVMQPFEQLDNRYNRGSGGTGLGLALVKALMEMHEGRVGIQSEVGVGTTVWVRFPPLSERKSA